MASKSGVSFKPSDFTDGISQLIASGEKPPRYPPQTMHLLDFHNTGIAAVKEVLKDKPVPHKAYRELSRYASHVAATRLFENKMITDLCEAFTEYRTAKRKHTQRVRKSTTDFLEGVSRGYSPFVGERGVRVWFWDEDEKDAVLSRLGDAGVALSVFFAFVADALSELEDLGGVKADLVEEYRFGLVYLRRVLVVVKNSIVELNEASFT